MRDLREYLERRIRSVISEIESESEDYILNVNDREYLEFRCAQAKVEHLVMYPDRITTDSVEREIPAEEFPRKFHVFPGKTYKANINGQEEIRLWTRRLTGTFFD